MHDPFERAQAMRRNLMWIAVSLVALASVAGAALLWLLGRPLYDPGSVRAGVDVVEPLEPPATRSADPAFFQVSEDIRLFTFSEGAGEPLLVIHGGPGFPPAAPWRVGAALADRFRLVYYHQRGCGKSSRPITKLQGDGWKDMKTLHARLGLPAQIADVERIRRLLGLDRVVLVGHSFGALIASLYAAEFPERVSALILVAPAPLLVLPVEGGDVLTRIAAAVPAPERMEFESWRKELLDFRARLREPDDLLADRYARFGRFFAKAAGVTLPAGDRPGGLQPYAIFLGLGQRHDWRAAFSRVTVPVLVVHGARDLQSEDQSRSVAAAFPKARFVVIPGAGHMVHEDAPVELAAAIREFLGTRGKGLSR
jgi:proline iminopeptidase